MDDETPSRRSRLGASTLSAAALLVLTFGPSALALSPSAPAVAAPARPAISAPAAAAVALSTPRAQDEDDAPDAEDPDSSAEEA